MDIKNIEEAADAKRQLNGARALMRWVRGGDSLEMRDFCGVSRGSRGSSSDFPTSLTASSREAMLMLEQMEARLIGRLRDLGISDAA